MSPWAIPALVALVLQLWLNVYVFLRRPIRPVSMPLHGMLLAALLFIVGDLFGNFILPGSETRWFGYTLLYSGLIFLGPLWWLLALRFAEAQEAGYRFTRSPWVYLPIAIGVFLWLGLLTNPWSGQFLSLVPGKNSIRHWMWWANAANNYAALAAVSAIYAHLFFRTTSREIRTRVVILVLATFSTGIASATFVFSGIEMPFDPTSVGVGISSLLFIVGIYRTRLFSLSPVAWTEVIDHQPGGVLIFGLEGQLLFANRNAIRMLDIKDLPASAQVFPALARKLRPEKDSDGRISIDALRETLTQPDQDKAGHLFRHGPRGESWVRVHAAAVPGRRGTTKAWSLHLADETELQHAAADLRENQEALAHAQKLESLGVFAGGIAHDFNNMLQSVLGNTDLALEETREIPRVRMALEEVESAAVRASRLVHQLLLFSGQSRTTKNAFELSELLESIERSARQQLSENIELHLNVEKPLPVVHADVDQLEQALHSLIANASDSIGDNPGTIEIRAEAIRVGVEEARALPVYETLGAGTYLRIGIHDSGRGVYEEIRDRVFEPFFSTKFAGRGLGLAGVLGVARGHNGSTGFENVSGGGAIFSIYLPTTKATPPQLHVEPRLPAEPPGGDRVLVVDDEAAVRSICARILRSRGFLVDEATCGKHALEIQRNQEFDVAIVDLTMPGIDGLETARRLRKFDPSLAVILCSGFDDLHDESWSQPGIADAFLHKPYRAGELIELIRQVATHRTAPSTGSSVA